MIHFFPQYIEQFFFKKHLFIIPWTCKKHFCLQNTALHRQDCMDCRGFTFLTIAQNFRMWKDEPLPLEIQLYVSWKCKRFKPQKGTMSYISNIKILEMQWRSCTCGCRWDFIKHWVNRVMLFWYFYLNFCL